MPLAEGATAQCLLQGVLGFALASVLAARLRKAPVVTAVLGAAILFAPMLVSHLPALKAPGSSSATPREREHFERLAKQWSLPAEQREQWAASELRRAVEKGFSEAPEIQAESSARLDRLTEWLRAHPADANRIRLELASKRHRLGSSLTSSSSRGKCGRRFKLPRGPRGFLAFSSWRRRRARA